MTARVDTAELWACEVAVLRALEIAGKRSLGRKSRGTAPRVAAHLLHTHLHIAATHTDCDHALAGAWDHLRLVLPGQPRLYSALDWYVRELIVKRRPHHRADLATVLAVAGET